MIFFFASALTDDTLIPLDFRCAAHRGLGHPGTLDPRPFRRHRQEYQWADTRH
jgi:hypothetical protein